MIPDRSGARPLGRATRRRGRSLLWAAVLVAAVACAVLAAPVLRGRTSPPSAARDAARHALDQARSRDAATWAPQTLREAEELLHRALTDYRRQELRFVSLRDYRAVRESLRRARERSDDAAREALEKMGETRAAAEETIALAGRTLGDAETVAATVPLEAAVRGRLQRARMSLHEARSRFDRGDLAGALERGAEASDAAREVVEHGTARTARYFDRGQVARWRRWIDETVAWSRRTGRPAVVIVKERNLLTLYEGGQPVREYRTDLSLNGVDAKVQGGDRATPEGRYRVTAKKGPGRTAYYKALLLDYPNAEDLRRFEAAQRSGLVSRSARPGGLIEIHGEGGRGEDWTRGCPALSNEDMDDLYERVEVGTPVTIVGGDGTPGRYTDLHRSFASHAGSTDR